MTRKATQTANIYASLYEGKLHLGYECVGVDACRFALCSTMPPEEGEECIYRDHGDCRQLRAQHAALRKLSRRLAGEVKHFFAEVED